MKKTPASFHSILAVNPLAGSRGHNTMIIVLLFFALLAGFSCKTTFQKESSFKPFRSVISCEQADKRANTVLAKLSIQEKVQLISGHNRFFIKGFEEHNIPQLYLSDATQGVHIRKELSDQLEKSTAFPCPLSLTATWNTELAKKYATSVGEECRAGDIAVLLGPGMNIYRISQCGRNFEYFGEDPFLAARMIENYVVGVQSTGTIATLKHFCCNNTDFHRRTTNSVVDERTLHEIYLPAFKAGIDAGAMAVMTSYNQVNGEWAGQSDYVINKLLRGDLGHKWLVMTDWWSVWDAEKVIKSGQDLEMPGEGCIKKDALKLLEEGKISESDINRMAKSIIRTCIAMGLYDRPVKDEKYLQKFPDHEKVALQTAREGIVLLRNEKNILPIVTGKKILLTGDYVEKLAKGGGSAAVEGYNVITMLAALKTEFGDRIEYLPAPTDEQIRNADIVLLSIGTDDSEGWDRSFSLPAETDQKIINMAEQNPNLVVIVNSGAGIRMTDWYQKVAAIVYAWYPGQTGNTALAEILSGKVNPSGKLPITIEKNFEDSPGYPYIPEGEQLYTGRQDDRNMNRPINNIIYDEGVFVGYRWYESRKIEPLYPFGFGLSYSKFEYGNLKLSDETLKAGDQLVVEFEVRNTGKVAGAEIAQLYVQDLESSVPRPLKELKGFKKVFLKPGEGQRIRITLTQKDLAFWDVNKRGWLAEPGDFNILVGAASNDIRLAAKVNFKG
ncbi:MAG: glycoside hydrolase family 3 C-terminal domain-containing protein [candidate division KSB1 bacterium]|nr:glycoside hydrolase family 3 C-terminal domain-containing protein [candidate division KSB1 bacterium]MDZ7314348.1 glycoside hydrolase family 3 C-terminal domain-containing protein [candidate division KSB1 bacterium]